MAKAPDPRYQAWYEGEKNRIPLGAEVRGSADLDARLSKASKNSRRRDGQLQGVVVAYDDVQCRFLVYWHHPAYDKLEPAMRPLEPLAPNYLELANG